MHGRLHLRPAEIRDMTVPEIALALDDDLKSRRMPAGAVPLRSYQEQLDFVARRRAMTPREKLLEAQSKRFVG